MYKWYLEQTVNGDVFTEELEESGTKEEAISEALTIWESLSRNDQKRRTEFCVIEAETDSDGCMMYDTILDSEDLLGTVVYINTETGMPYTLVEMEKLWDFYSDEMRFDTFEDFCDSHKKVEVF